jgi:hypothetical protein
MASDLATVVSAPRDRNEKNTILFNRRIGA